jgi:hypothetical protein
MDIAGSSKSSRNIHLKSHSRSDIRTMCMNMGETRQQSFPFVSGSPLGDWHCDPSPARLFHRGAVVPMRVATHSSRSATTR